MTVPHGQCLKTLQYFQKYSTWIPPLLDSVTYPRFVSIGLLKTSSHPV